MQQKKQANTVTHLLNLLAKDSEKVECQETTLSLFKRDRTLELLFKVSQHQAIKLCNLTNNYKYVPVYFKQQHTTKVLR